MSTNIKFGKNDIPFVYKGDKLIYPNPIKDGLLLWYDFKGMRNTDVNRGIAKDLSGNGNHGTLQNFAYNTSDFNLPDLYKNTKLIVKDPSDPIYSGYPNPPVGAVFNNYNPVSNKIVRGNIDMPALANTLIANMKLYHLYNDSVFLENAKIIGDYISSLMRNFSFYGADIWVVPNRVSLIDGEWTPLYSEINTRSLLQALYALSEVLKETGLYGSEVYQLTQTIGLIHNNIKSRVAEGELRTAMNGAVYEYIYINEDTDALVFSWGEFGISSSDMIAKAMNSYIESMGEDVIYDSQGTEFTPQQILDGAAEHIKAVYDSGTLTMEPTGLPYGFLRADSESETGVNWDWVDTQEHGDTWFTNDTTLWIIEGISRLSQLTEIEGLYNIAKTYRDNFLALRELNHDSYDDKGDTRVIFYDRYNFDGSHLIEDVSISISGTALLWEVDEILGINDGVLHSQMRDTIEAHIITNKNSDINGAFGWDANDATSFIEMKATGEIYFSPFIQAQAGSSVSSGYKDNTLIFDGVDDSLTIPELELDETAMTVMHDGNLYAYEDDKVIKVKKYSDGARAELEGLEVGGRNYLQNSDFSKGIDEYWAKMNSSPQENFRVGDGLLTVISNPDSNSDFGRTRFLQENHLEEQEYITISSSMKGTGSLTVRFGGSSMPIKSIDNDDFKRVVFDIPRANFGNGNLIIGISSGELTFNRIKAETGSKATDWTPAPEDFQTTSLSPSSLFNLQLYNHPLRKDELLHNAESKGLKKLKPGVVVQDGLVLHYDFSHESNTSEYKGKAFDYSGNGNHGELQNFNFTEESGYVGNKLKFDGVDDFVGDINIRGDSVSETYTFVVRVNESKRNNFLYAGEELKIDLYYNRITRADVNPSLSIRHNAGYETFYGVLVKDGLEHTTYINGVVVDKSILNSAKSSRLINIGNYVPQGRPSIDLFDLKAYNRPLTAEEIQHNYQIEKEKYNIVEGEM